MTILAITQARVGSSRLPAKVLKEVNGMTLLSIHLKRLLKSHKISQLLVATTLEPDAQKICDIATAANVKYYRGNMNDVLDRFYQAALPYKPDYVVRITSDCPLLDAAVVDAVIEQAIANGTDYTSNTMEHTFPNGQDVEVFTFAALEKAWQEATLKSDREHVTPFIWRNSSYKNGTIFRSENIVCNKDLGHIRLTVDEPEDFEVVRILVEHLGADATWEDYVEHLKIHPEIQRLNSHIPINEGYQRSLDRD